MFATIEEYLKVPFPDQPTFFDVGANAGLWIDAIVTRYPQCVVYGFEPVPDITSSYDNVKIFNYAIDVEPAKGRPFYVTRDNVTSSLLQLEGRVVDGFIDFTHENGKVYRKSDLDVESIITVETRRLDAFIDENGIAEVHYLKIDAEGNDLNVFKSLGEKRRIVWAFEMEVWNRELTMYKGSTWRDPALRFVESQGFSVVDEFVHGRGKSTDFLFVRTDLLKS